MPPCTSCVHMLDCSAKLSTTGHCCWRGPFKLGCDTVIVRHYCDCCTPLLLLQHVTTSSNNLKVLCCTAMSSDLLEARPAHCEWFSASIMQCIITRVEFMGTCLPAPPDCVHVTCKLMPSQLGGHFASLQLHHSDSWLVSDFSCGPVSYGPYPRSNCPNLDVWNLQACVPMAIAAAGAVRQHGLGQTIWWLPEVYMLRSARLAGSVHKRETCHSCHQIYYRLTFRKHTCLGLWQYSRPVTHGVRYR